GRAPGTELADDRAVHGVDELVDVGAVDAGDGRVGAHPTGVGAGVALPGALEVARGSERQDVAAVAEREQGKLVAFEQLLDDHVVAEAAGGGKSVLELVPRVADEDALAACEAVELDDARRPWLVERSGGRDPGGLHHRLRESLRTLDSRGGRVRSERC